MRPCTFIKSYIYSMFPEHWWCYWSLQKHPLTLARSESKEFPVAQEADKECIEWFHRGHEQWNHWRQLKQHVKPDLTGIDLSGKDISKYNLSYCTLDKANFKGAHLQNINFQGTSLVYANFEESHLNAVYFPNANLSGTCFRGSHLTGCIFTGAVVLNTGFVDCSFQNPSFNGSHFGGRAFQRCSFEYADFTGAHFFLAEVVDSNFLNSNFRISELNCSALINCSLEHCNLTRMKFPSAIFANCNLKYIRFDLDHLEAEDASDTIQTPMKLNWAKLRIIGRIPLFSASYITLFVCVLSINSNALINKILLLWEPKVNVGPFDLPSNLYWAFLSSLLLATGSIMYSVLCPQRIQEFSESKWVDELEQARLLYLADAWRLPWFALFTTISTLIGGIIAVILFLGQLQLALQQLLKAWNS